MLCDFIEIPSYVVVSQYVVMTSREDKERVKVYNSRDEKCLCERGSKARLESDCTLTITLSEYLERD